MYFFVSSSTDVQDAEPLRSTRYTQLSQPVTLYKLAEIDVSSTA